MADSARTQPETSPPGVREVSQIGGETSKGRLGALQQGTSESFDRIGQKQGYDAPTPRPNPRCLFMSGDTITPNFPEALDGDGAETGQDSNYRGVPSHQADGGGSSNGGGLTRRASRLLCGEEGLTIKETPPPAGIVMGKTPAAPASRPSAGHTSVSRDGLGDKKCGGGGGDGGGGGGDGGGGGCVGDFCPTAPASLEERKREECLLGNSGPAQVHRWAPASRPAVGESHKKRKKRTQGEKERESQDLEHLQARVAALEDCVESEVSLRFEAQCRVECLENELSEMIDRCGQEIAARMVADSNLARYMELFREARAAWQNTQGIVEKKERELAAADVKIDGEAGGPGSFERRLEDVKRGKEQDRKESLALKLAMEASPGRDTSPDAFPSGKHTVRFSEEALERGGHGSASADICGKGEVGVSGRVTEGSMPSRPQSSHCEDRRRAAVNARLEAAIVATAVTTENSEEVAPALFEQQRVRLNHVDETERQQQQQQQQGPPRDQLHRRPQQDHNAPAKDRSRDGVAPSGRTKTTSAPARETQLSPSAPSFYPPSFTTAALHLRSKQQQQQSQQHARCERQDSNHASLCTGFEKISLRTGDGGAAGAELMHDTPDDGDYACNLAPPVSSSSGNTNKHAVCNNSSGGVGNSKGRGKSEDETDTSEARILEQTRAATANVHASVEGRSGGEEGKEEGRTAGYGPFASGRSADCWPGATGEGERVLGRAMVFLEALDDPQDKEKAMATLGVGKGSAAAAMGSIMSGDKFLELHKTKEGIGELLTALGTTGLAF